MNRSTTEIWETFNDELRSFIAWRVSDPYDVDDILQDVFIKIHSKLETLKEEDRLIPWLYQIARRTVVDYYRERRVNVELPESLSAQDSDEEDDAEKHLANGLRAMIGCLPEKYREALLLTEIKGLKQQELAKHLGISLSGAKSRVQRGRELLHQSLLDCCHFVFDRRGHVVEYTPHPECCNSCRTNE